MTYKFVLLANQDIRILILNDVAEFNVFKASKVFRILAIVNVRIFLKLPTCANISFSVRSYVTSTFAPNVMCEQSFRIPNCAA